MKKEYIDSVMLFDRLHRLFLSIMKNDLSMACVTDMTPAQAMMVYHLMDKKIRISDVQHYNMYHGLNASYNVRKMHRHGYLDMNSVSDKRSVFVSLSKRGEDVYAMIEEIVGKHVKILEKLGFASEKITNLLDVARSLETTWQRHFF